MKRLCMWLACAVAAIGLSVAPGCGSSQKKGGGDTVPVKGSGGGDGDAENPCGANPCGDDDAEGGEGAAPGDGDSNDEEGEEETSP